MADGSRCSHILSVTHQARASGHRFHTSSAACHPLLPLLLTTARYSPTQDVGQNLAELILWRVDSVGPLAESGGLLELARIDSPSRSAFSHVAWLPKLLPSTSLDTHTNSPAAMLVISDGSSLRLCLAIVDARALLYIPSNKKNVDVDEVGLIEDEEEQGGVPMNLISKQSTARPGCILELDEIERGDWSDVALVHAFDGNTMNTEDDDDMYIVLVRTNGEIHMWRVHVVAPGEFIFFSHLTQISTKFLNFELEMTQFSSLKILTKGSHKRKISYVGSQLNLRDNFKYRSLDKSGTVVCVH